MSETKHTPGPWRVQNGYRNCDYACLVYADNAGDGNGALVAICRWDTYQAGQNANLIAAAPDLLEACKMFVMAWEKSLQLEKTDQALALAKHAIAKARGETP